MNKQKRQNLIVKLISEHDIKNQSELLKYMALKGCISTQATISRDIKDLKIVKEDSNNKQSKYVINDLSSFIGKDKDIKKIFSNVILKLDIVKNTVVVKCKDATAAAACLIIDNLNYDGLVGTIAGHNTIFVLMESDERAASFKKDIESRL